MNPMQYIVEARLFKEKARLRVLYAELSHICFQCDPVEFEQMFESREIYKEGLLHPDFYGMELLYKKLFLIACFRVFGAATP